MAGIEMEGLREFARNLRMAAGPALREELRLLNNAMGMRLLEKAQDEVIAAGSVVTGNLVNSLSKGGADNLWDESDGGLTLDVGTSLEYARYVNDGHHTTPAGVAERWVPGHWDGGRFVYEPGARTGMLLRRKWIEGKHFWEHAVAGCEPEFQRAAEDAVSRWAATWFGA